MVQKSGDSDAENIQFLVISEYPSLPTMTSQPISVDAKDSFKIVSSKDLGDPEMGTVIQWHLALCPICDPNTVIHAFGHRATSFCAEYFEIIQEYREYEGRYAMMGDP